MISFRIYIWQESKGSTTLPNVHKRQRRSNVKGQTTSRDKDKCLKFYKTQTTNKEKCNQWNQNKTKLTTICISVYRHERQIQTIPESCIKNQTLEHCLNFHFLQLSIPFLWYIQSHLTFNLGLQSDSWGQQLYIWEKQLGNMKLSLRCSCTVMRLVGYDVNQVTLPLGLLKKYVRC